MPQGLDTARMPRRRFEVSSPAICTAATAEIRPAGKGEDGADGVDMWVGGGAWRTGIKTWEVGCWTGARSGLTILFLVCFQRRIK
jgi:hypothetical protein